jgi:hypothetical protein
LTRKILDQLDLPVGERPDLLTVYADGADELSLSIGTMRRVRAPARSASA